MLKKEIDDGNAAKINELLDTLVKNEIAIRTRKPKKGASFIRSKFGGLPAVPDGFKWPGFAAENHDGELADRPLSFLCQINLNEIAAFDKDSLLHGRGLLLFFYEQESMCWGYDPKDKGCSRVFLFENTDDLRPMDFPDDLDDEYRVKEYDLLFKSGNSYPCFEELECHSDYECDWDDYDNELENKKYDPDSERHKLLGYANLIQGEMLTECERVSRGLYSGDFESYKNTPEKVREDVLKSASEWILLFQMASIQDDDYELMFGDVGNLYFYIRKEDLKENRFDNVWLVSQCY